MKPPHDNCETTCQLFKNCKNPFLLPKVDMRLETREENCILVVSDYTDMSDDREGSYFYSKARGYHIIEDILDNLECRYVFTTALACGIDDANIKPAQMKKYMRACFEVKLKPLILKYKPKVIICLGKQAMDALLQEKAPKTLKTITQTGMSVEFYEEHHPILNSLIVGLNHPRQFLSSKTDVAKLEATYKMVFGKAEDFCRNSDKRLPVEYELIDTPSKLYSLATDPKIVKFAFDIENTHVEADIYKNTIWKKNSKILSLAITYRNSKNEYKNKVIVGKALEDKYLIERLFKDRHVVAHNISHDSQGIYRLCGVDIWPLVKDYDDTMAKFYLADQNRLQNDLKNLSAQYLGVYDYADDVKRFVTEANNRIAVLRKQIIKNAKEKLKHFKWYQEALQWKNEGVAFSSAKRRNLQMVLDTYSSLEEIKSLLEICEQEVKDLPAEGSADYGDIPIAVLAAYNAEDTLCTLRLDEEILPFLSKYDPSFGRQDPLWADSAYTLYKRAVRMSTYVSRNGLPIDIDSLNEMGEVLKIKEREVREKLLERPEVITALESIDSIAIRKEKGTLTKAHLLTELSPTKKKFMDKLCLNLKLGRFGKETNTGLSFTGKAVIGKIAKHYEDKGNESLARLFKDFVYISNNRQVRSKFIKNWNKYYVPEDKCFHPVFKLMKNQPTLYANKDADGGAGSGRLSCSLPNTTQIRKVAYLRKHFKARPGYKFVEIDYCQLEVYIIAWLSGCEQLKETFRKGYDIYCVTANEIFFKGTDKYIAIDPNEPAEEVNKRLKKAMGPLRDKMKVAFLAWAYGRSKPSFARDLNLSEAETDAFYENAEKIYHEIFTWKQGIIEDIKEGNPITTPFGRFKTAPITPPEPGNWRDLKRYNRELSKIIRSIVNFPPQGTGSDICLWMASNIQEWILTECYQDVIKIVNLVHDAIWFEIKETQLDWSIEKLQGFMEDVSCLPFNFDIPLRTEASSGYKLSDYIKNQEMELVYE